MFTILSLAAGAGVQDEPNNEPLSRLLEITHSFPQENNALFLYNKIFIAQAVYICSPYLALSVNQPLQEHTIFFNNVTD